MWRTKRHVPDGELLLLDEDGALSARRRAAVSRHVAACPHCARRRAELAAMLAGAAAACRATPAGASPPHAARARLRAEMEARSPRWSFARWPVPAAGAAAIVALVALLSWPAADRRVPSRGSVGGVPGPARVGAGAQASNGLERPRQDLTPGRVLPVGVDEVCGPGVSGLPPVAAQVPRQVFEAYGVDYRRAADYELDFLITPELGGAPDPRNLWPQPYRAGVWNAYVKDELERELQALVCRGALDLATAQQELADDWIAAYKRRFNTDRPLRDYGRFPLGPDDVEALRSELAERRLLPAGEPIADAGLLIAAPSRLPARAS